MTLKLVQHQLMLLPGWDGTGWLFQPFLNHLPPECAASVVSYPADYVISANEMVPRLRDQMAWDGQVILVAESCAGPLALEFACEQPEQVRAIVLVNSFVTNPLSPWLDWLAKWWLKPWAWKLPSSKFIRKYLLGPEAPDVLVDALSQALGSVTPKVLASRVEEVMRLDARAALTRCRAPILNLVGTQDMLVGERGWSGIAGVHPYLTTVTIDGPHLLLQTHPRETATAIDEFLTALPRCARAA